MSFWASLSGKGSHPPYFEDLRDGHRYKLTKIAGQVWFAENLAYIPHVSSAADDGGIWVNGYNWKDASAAKRVSNYDKYGCLYNFESAQKCCPQGWRLPTRADFTKLLNLAGGTEYDDRLKVYSNLGTSGTLGFKGLLAGGRRPPVGSRSASFTPPGEFGDSWSCERADDIRHGLFSKDEALGHTLHVQTERFSGHFFLDAAPLTYGLSVRCIKP
jgi:uncharacterized protein (TIGR02145 family)